MTKVTTSSKTWTGGTCQLEALPPDVIADILRNAIVNRIDWQQLHDDFDAQEHDRMMIGGLLPPPSSGALNNV